MALAIFDLDYTLLSCDSDHSWGEFLCQKGIVDEQVYRETNDKFLQQYLSGTMDIREFLRFALKPLTELPLEQLKQLHQEFMASCILPMITDKAKALLQQHRDQGDYLLIITATNGFITRPIAEYLGVDDILATDPEFKEGRYTGEIVGTPCFQHGKVDRLNAWLEQTGHSLEGASFYSDSINDLPLLEAVEKPVATNPDERLLAIATERDWPVMRLH